jgi:hypothetical protein
MLLVLMAALAPATAASATGPSLQRVVLRSPQIGGGYIAKVIRGGRAVRGQVTLDMCGFHFRSESSRSERLQTAYIRPGSTLSLSNEVVRYRPGGAAFAMREIAQAIRTCPRGPVPSTVHGVPPLTYRISRLSGAGQGLLRDSILMKVTASGLLNGKKLTQTSFVVYERSGNILSGIYVYGGSLNARRAMAIHAAAESARNLRRA